jgi:bifunctional non-homologous end joining protein LigD
MKTRTKNTLPSKGTMPTSVKPMLCMLIKEPFNNPDYIYEVKWDGYRIISYVSSNSVRMESRGGQDYTRKYPSLVKALSALGNEIILDGEVVVPNAEGKPDFDALQKFNGQKSGTKIRCILLCV